MKTLRSYTFILTTALALSACSSGVGIGFGVGNAGGGVNFGTGISFPIGGLGVRNDAAKSGINLIDVQVVSYFGTAAQGYQPVTTRLMAAFTAAYWANKASCGWCKTITTIPIANTTSPCS